jgi:hypothetical protein
VPGVVVRDQPDLGGLVREWVLGPKHRPQVSGCGSEGDGEPECFDLADVAAGLAAGVGAAGVVAGAQLVVAGGGAGEQVPDDDQDGAGESDQGTQLAAAPDDPPVALAEEAAGPGGRSGGFAEGALEIGVALPVLPGETLSSPVPGLVPGSVPVILS